MVRKGGVGAPEPNGISVFQKAMPPGNQEGGQLRGSLDLVLLNRKVLKTERGGHPWPKTLEIPTDPFLQLPSTFLECR